jgi:hypothetical protein
MEPLVFSELEERARERVREVLEAGMVDKSFETGRIADVTEELCDAVVQALTALSSKFKYVVHMIVLPATAAAVHEDACVGRGGGWKMCGARGSERKDSACAARASGMRRPMGR